MRWRALFVAVLVVQGCGEGVGLICTDQYVYAVTVEVRDSVTGGPLGSPPTGILTDGQYREDMELHGDLTLQGGGERPGTYEIEVRAAGYHAWRMEGVEANHDGCHVENVQLLATMVPSTAP